jgi:hypothetical protein
MIREVLTTHVIDSTPKAIAGDMQQGKRNYSPHIRSKCILYAISWLRYALVLQASCFTHSQSAPALALTVMLATLSYKSVGVEINAFPHQVLFALYI